MSLKSDSAKKLRKEKKKWHAETPEQIAEMEDAFLKERLLGKEPTIKGQIRVSGGSVKNFNIDIPRNTRPLTDRVKVRIFDILGSDIVKKSVLDLFAGSGSFGIEALSRGASSATFVDASKHSERIIGENVEKTGLDAQSEIIRAKVDEYLPKAIKGEETFDIIFMDPPYKLFNRKKITAMHETITNVAQLLPGIAQPKSTKFKGALIVKHPRQYPIETLEVPKLRKVETYHFGLNSLSLYIVD